MGFSVSGSAAIIFAGLFIAFGAWHAASSNTVERVHEAQEGRSDTVLETQNAAINITSVSYDTTTNDLTVTAENQGAAQLTLEQTDLLLDGRYVADWQSGADVEGDSQTNLWLAGETLTITLTDVAQPDRVKVITDNGVADVREEVTLL